MRKKEPDQCKTREEALSVKHILIYVLLKIYKYKSNIKSTQTSTLSILNAQIKTKKSNNS